jgi:hypothetical protein
MTNTKHLRDFVAVLDKIQSDIKPDDDVLQKIRDQAASTQDDVVACILGLYYSDVEELIEVYQDRKIDILKEHYKVMCKFIDCVEKVPDFQLGLEAFATFNPVLFAYAVCNKVEDLTPKETAYYHALFELFVNELNIEPQIREFLSEMYSQVPSVGRIDLAEQKPENNNRELTAFFIVFRYMLRLVLSKNNEQLYHIIINPLSDKIPTFLWKFMIEHYADKNADSTKWEAKDVSRILLSSLFTLSKLFPFLFYLDRNRIHYWELPSNLIESIIEPVFLKSKQGKQFAEVTKRLAKLPLPVQEEIIHDVPSISSLEWFSSSNENNDRVTKEVELIQNKLEEVVNNVEYRLPKEPAAKFARVDKTTAEEERERILSEFRIQMY